MAVVHQLPYHHTLCRYGIYNERPQLQLPSFARSLFFILVICFRRCVCVCVRARECLQDLHGNFLQLWSGLQVIAPSRRM